ncbi:MAG: c-type cytochrome [Hyphomicrobiales bacterium]|nr:c-type cytochrome [Hyphomicrobiales bacterium]
MRVDAIVARSCLVGVAALVVLGHGNAARAQDGPPAWAYPVNPPGFKPPPDDGTIRRSPGSSAGYTLTQLRDRFLAPDWHPADYPAMPEIVARGRKPDVHACGFCHRADGPGGPENANLTGLPKAYIVRQMHDFRSGARKSSVPQRDPIRLKDQGAKAITEAEIETAAAYFASIRPRSIVRVVESATAPKSRVTAWYYSAVPSGEQEPIGQRIVEVPETPDLFVNRDTRARFVAYVPEGSIKRGQALATTGGGRTIACGTCHGGGTLKGVPAIAIPGIAGRSPSYLVRQLYDFKHGARAGSQAILMRSSVDRLTLDDMIALAAYAASLAP